MALAREIYRALEDVVGERNISEDRGILETYRLLHPVTKPIMALMTEKTPLPQAVVLPGARKSAEHRQDLQQV